MPAPASVPVHYRSPAFHEVEVGPFRITDVRFDPGSRIEPHHHDRPNLGIMLDGSFDLQFGSRSFACLPGVVFVEPAGETHCNCMGCRGARVLAVQPNPEDPDLSLTAGPAFREPAQVRSPHAIHLGRRIARESRLDDAFSPLMIQGLVLELLAVAGRAHSRPGPQRSPAWLTRVEALLHSAVPSRVALSDLAREAGVHSAHVAREFRRRHGRSLGSFVLEQRLEWAARQLVATEQPIVEIAFEAGFADQSHFTRRFRDYTGETPHRFRAGTKGAKRLKD